MQPLSTNDKQLEPLKEECDSIVPPALIKQLCYYYIIFLLDYRAILIQLLSEVRHMCWRGAIKNYSIENQRNRIHLSLGNLKIKMYPTFLWASTNSGMFMSCVQLLSQHKRKIVHNSCRSAMLKYKSELARIIELIFTWPALLTGYKDEKQWVDVELLDEFLDDPLNPAVKLEFQVS